MSAEYVARFRLWHPFDYKSASFLKVHFQSGFCSSVPMFSLSQAGPQLYRAVHRLPECYRRGQAEVVCKSKNKILATWERQLSHVLYVKGAVGTGDIPGRFSEHDGRKRSHKLAPIRLFLVLPSSFSLLPLSLLPFGFVRRTDGPRARLGCWEAFNLAADRIMRLSTRCYDFPRRGGEEKRTWREERNEEPFEMPLKLYDRVARIILPDLLPDFFPFASCAPSPCSRAHGTQLLSCCHPT